MSGPSAPTRLSMPGQVHKAHKVMLKLLHPKFVSSDQQIPLRVLKKAKGVAFVTVVKAGFIWSGTLGSGIVIARLPDGTWSGPSSLGVVGMGWGGLIGASVTDSVIILNTDLAVKAFAGHGQIKFGGNLSVSAGPLGREADGSAYAGDGGVAACYSYSHSRGLFAGISLQGAVFVTRDSDNAKFYGSPVKAKDVLKGLVKPPESEDLRNLVALLSSVRDDGNAAAVSGSSQPDFSSGKFGSTALDDDDEGEDYAEQVQLEALGWAKIKDATGKAYYWHAEQNKTQWDNPLLSLPAAAAPPPAVLAFAPPPAAQVQSTLPPGWVSLPAGDGLGSVYYWHQERNITQWEMPSGGGAVAPAPVRPMSLPRQDSMLKQYAPTAQPQPQHAADGGGFAAFGSYGEVRQPAAVPKPVAAPYVAPVAAPYVAPKPVAAPYAAPKPVAAPYAAPAPATTTAPPPALKARPAIPPRPSSSSSLPRPASSQNPFQQM